MTKQESLEAIIHLSSVIGWLQHYRNTSTKNIGEDVAVDFMLQRLAAIRESICKDYEAKEAT